MQKKTLLALILALALITLSFTGLPAVLSKSGVFSELNAAASDFKSDGCINCHQPRPDIGRDLRLSVLTSNIKNHTQITLNTIASSKIPTVCTTCHQNRLGNMLHLIHLGYEINLENNSTIIYAGECLYCHTPDRLTDEMSVKTGYEAKPDS
jgi:cytochrome c553